MVGTEGDRSRKSFFPICRIGESPPRVILWDIEAKKAAVKVELGEYINTLCWRVDGGGEIFAGGKDGMLVKMKF